MAKVQDLALGLVEPHPIGFGPVIHMLSLVCAHDIYEYMYIYIYMYIKYITYGHFSTGNKKLALRARLIANKTITTAELLL